MKKAVYSVMIITMIGKILGFGREILLSFYFGANGISDGYLISQTIPGTIFQFVGTGLATSFIPVYIKIKRDNGKTKADLFTNTIISIIMGFSTLVIIVVLIFARPIVKIFASGFSGQILDHTVLFTRITIFNLYFSAISYVFSSYLQANEIFAVTTFVAIPNSVIIMISIFLGAKYNLIALPVGSILSVFVQMLVLWAAMKNQDFCFKPNYGFKDHYVNEAAKLMFPVIIGISVNQINVLIDRTLASQILIGGISALLYADSLIMFVQGIFSQSIATVYYPSITKYVKEQDDQLLKEVVKEALTAVSFILMPIMIGCMIIAQDIIGALYGRGAFNKDAIILTGTALAFYGVGILGYGIREILSRIFYAFLDTKTPMRNAVAGMALNIILNIVLSKIMGIAGLALATSLSSTITAILLYKDMIKKIHGLFIKVDLKEYCKMGMAAVLMGVIVYVFRNTMDTGADYAKRTIILIVIGAVTYINMCGILKVNVYKKMVMLLVGKVKGKAS